MTQPQVRKAPPPPAFAKKTPPMPTASVQAATTPLIEEPIKAPTNTAQQEIPTSAETIYQEQATFSDENQPSENPEPTPREDIISEDYAQKIQSEITIDDEPQQYIDSAPKNEDADISSFSKDIENDLMETFGNEIMSSFITDKDRIGAAYIITQSVINTYIEKHKSPDIKYALAPSDLDEGISPYVIQRIVDDLGYWHHYFSEHSEDFNKNKSIYALWEPDIIDVHSSESIITYMLSMFKTLASLDNKNMIKQQDVHAPYESDMIKVNKLHNSKMWDLAEQVRQSIIERDAIIDEIALPVIKKGYPIDARKMAANFLRESKKNYDIAINALYSNPATFAPILVEKLPRTMMGLKKPCPKDAIEINKSLGRFLKKFVS